MDPTKLLEADHRKVEALFDAIEEAEGDARQPLIDELRTSLEAHMTLEEEILYPVLPPITGEETVEEGTTEHDLSRRAVEEMVALAPDEPGFGAARDATEAGISHHVEEEEDEVFPELRKASDVLAGITEPFLARRRELGLPLDAETLGLGFTKEELLDEARDAGLEGYSSMTKDELAEALAATLA